ncbi:uncharacterized protein LOC112511475 [Cynara cardunculus var. scolymus]|uniref:uncharacterized protein LOC112511475 n=1 Tax=Cynara cardunculus var. scolymus TaxID=59895 RepID=UPI000D627493|nr:uncharacterized protein LOC112511475 [Cynara cardunculus var. scolymus]
MFDLNPQFLNKPNHPVDKLNHKFVGWSDSGFARNHGNYRQRFNGGGGVGVQFRLETMEEDSGICSPPLWRSISPPDSPVRFNNPRLLSPSSRAQAIARGQREIMEMVENMPETSYELSLKDIVEQRRDLTETSLDETQSMEEGEERSILRGGQTDSQRWRKSKKGSVKRQESNKTGRIIVKNGSLNHNKGLLINMFFPFSIGSKKNKKNNKTSITTSSSFGNHIASAKFSPKPELLDKSSKDGGGGGDRRDGWWKKFTGSSDSESLRVTSSSSGESTGRSGSSGSSGSSTAGSLRSNSTRNNSNCSHGCWSFFPSKKRKS